MTREEKEAVLHCLRVLIDEALCEECPLYDKTGTNYCGKDCVRLVIKALEQQTCGDAVSREAVLGLFADNADAVRPYSKTWEEVKALPSVNPQSNVGHWIYDDTTNNWRCDKCGETPKTMGYVGTDKFMAEHFKFCNHCGAKMVEPQESEGKK